MIYFVLIIFMVIEVFFFFAKVTDRYISPYTLTVIFGRKGSGKSTLEQKLATQHYQNGWSVFCDKGDSHLPFVREIDAQHMYQYKFPPNSLIMVGEASMYWDNRDFKDFPKPMQKFLRLQRHKRIKIIMFTQTYDTDKKIRDLADQICIVRKAFRIFINARAYVKSTVILPASETRDTARIADDFVRLPFFSRYNLRAFLPAWCSSHDSFKDDQSDYKINLT